MKKLKQEIKKCMYWMCGKQPKIKKYLLYYEIHCSGCGHDFIEFGTTREEAIKKWNKRMP